MLFSSISFNHTESHSDIVFHHPNIAIPIPGTPVVHWYDTVLENVEKISFRYVPKALMSFITKMLALICSLPLESWRRQNNIYPSNVMEGTTERCPPNAEAVSEEARILPCVQRLQKLEELYEELNNKPAEIPFEKEQMLHQSLDRIKSVEIDLDKTKRVRLVLSG